MTISLEKLFSAKQSFITTFLTDSFNTDDITTIKNTFSEVDITQKLQLFQEIYSLWKTYELTVNLQTFINSIPKENIKENLSELENIYEVIYFIYKKDNEFYKQLKNNFSINFWWTLHFYEINLEKFNNDYDNFKDHFHDHFKKITNKFNQKISNSLILYYSPDTVNDYYIIYYWIDKNNKSLNHFFTITEKIKSTNSFYFFFYHNEHIDKFYLVIRQAQHTTNIKKLIKSINSICNNCISLTYSNVIDFEQFEYDWHFNDPFVTSKYIHCSTSESSIKIEWENSLKVYNNFKKDNLLTIKELWLKIEKYNTWTKNLEYRLNWNITNNSIVYKNKDVSIIKFINHLQWLGFFINNQEKAETANYNEVSIFSKAIINQWKILINKTVLKNKELVQNFLLDDLAEYCWNHENLTDYKHEKFTFQWFNKDIKISSTPVTLENNFYINIDLNKILTEKDIKGELELKDSVYIFNYSNKWKTPFKNIEIVFSINTGYLTKYLLQNNNDNKKRIAFTAEKIDEKTQITLTQKFQCLIFDFSYIGNFLNDNKKFIQSESSRIILENDKKDITLFSKLKEMDIDLMSKNWEWSVFEEWVAWILSFFSPILIKLWKKYTWLPIPDGIIIPNNKIIIMYDAKSSANIYDYLKGEARKIKDYMQLFPKEWNNIFFIIWPEINQNEINNLKENSLWKELIHDTQWKIIYLWADILKFLQYIVLYESYEEIKWLINCDEIFQYFSKQSKIPWIYLIEFEKFHEYFIKYIFNRITEFNSNSKELSKNLEEKSDNKLSIIEISEQFEKHIKNYNKN